MEDLHLHHELALSSSEKVTIETRYGSITGGRARNGAIVFLEIPYALPPGRFEDPLPLNSQFEYRREAYIQEAGYAAQPTVDGQAAGTKYEDKVGYGAPTENPLFLNIILPPSIQPGTGRLPVRAYIHGGFLQFGSPHGFGSQAQYIAAERNEIWINIGYRLSAFGFLASDEPAVKGNFGFKDIWLALLWMRDNIRSFGGNPDDIQVSGLSAGAHALHRVLHHISHLPAGETSPLQSAVLQSNAILLNPKTATELRPQFCVFCRELGLDPDAPDTLQTLRDPAKITTKQITDVIDSGRLGTYDAFRGCLDGEWMQGDPMAWQRNGDFARKLKEKGVKSIILGDLKEEWYLYAIAWPTTRPSDIVRNVSRCFPEDFSRRLVAEFGEGEGEESSASDDESGQQRLLRRMGDVLACAQVYLPVRILHRDLVNAGFSVVRYDIRWVPEKSRVEGYVTHAGDRPLWTYRLPLMTEDEAGVARAWLNAVDQAKREVEAAGRPLYGVTKVLRLTEDKTIGWGNDDAYEGIIKLEKVAMKI